MLKVIKTFLFGHSLDEIKKAVAHVEFMPGMSGHGKLIWFFARARSANSPTVGQLESLGYAYGRNGLKPIGAIEDKRTYIPRRCFTGGYKIINGVKTLEKGFEIVKLEPKEYIHDLADGTYSVRQRGWANK